MECAGIVNPLSMLITHRLRAMPKFAATLSQSEKSENL